MSGQIQAALPVSLGFAAGLFQYLTSIKHAIVGAEHRALVRAAEVATAKGALVTVESLLQALGPKHEYPITRFICPAATDEPDEPIPPDSWEWFFKLVIEAAKAHEERIVPDVAVLVGDTTIGFRSGDFEKRYVLKREWFSRLFGLLADAMLYIFAQYRGTNEYALDAKKEAERWLHERQTQPPKSIEAEDPRP